MLKQGAGALAALAILGAGCSDSGPISAGVGDSKTSRENDEGCGRDADCPAGLICVEARCVSPDDLLPPDTEESIEARPVGTGQVLFALSRASDSVAVIDPNTLEIAAVDVAPDPVALAPVAGDSAVILSKAGRALTIVSRAASGELAAKEIPLLRQFTHVSVSPRGEYAVAWTGGDNLPDEGAEGLVTIVSLSGAEAPVEVAAGYRHTNVFFRETAEGTSAIIAGKFEVVIVDLTDPTRRAERVRLPDVFAEVIGREVVGGVNAEYLLIRSFAERGIGVLSVETSTITIVPLPGIPTDLDLVAGGESAVAAIRATSEVAILPLPESLTSSSAVRIVTIDSVIPGQVEVSQNGEFAAVFSTQDDVERFGWVELETGDLRVFDRLRKLVRQIGLAPDGATAVVIHRPNPSSTNADPYERAVDLDEGYSVVDLSSGESQLKRTGTVAPAELTFSPTGRTAAMTLRLDAAGARVFETVSLETLIVDAYDLASAPEFAGTFPEVPGQPTERFWVTQAHSAGRISFLDAESRQLKTATGFQLNSGISGGR